MFIAHAYLTINNYGGFELQLDDHGDSARLKYFDKVSRWQEIKYNRQGGPYVTYYGTTYKLDEFMAIR